MRALNIFLEVSIILSFIFSSKGGLITLFWLFEDKYDIVSLCEKYIKTLEKKQKDENLLLTSFQEGFMNKVDLSKLKK